MIGETGGRCGTCKRPTRMTVGLCGVCAADWNTPDGRARINRRRKANGYGPLDTPTKEDKMEATEQKQPTVAVMIGGSFITKDDRGEIIETVDTTPEGKPDWSAGGICDGRGAGGNAGFDYLHDAIDCAERNAKEVGLDIQRIGDE